MKKLIGKAIAQAAMAVTKKNVNSTCTCYFHQPKLPKAADKLRNTK